MAKPSPVASTDGASSSSPHPPRHRTDHKPRRRRRKPASAATSAARSLAPSPTLLSLLSLVAASSVAEGSPAPPTFLCPSLEPTATPTPVRKRHKSSTTSTPTHTKSVVPAVRSIAEKYEQGEDGYWRRVEYTLYGVCTNCKKGSFSAIDEQSVRPDDSDKADDTTKTDTVVSTTSKPTASGVMGYDTIPETLPPGWGPKDKDPYDHEGRTTLILAMSLVLAFVICILIIACLFWRKSLRRKYKDQDLEGKGKGKARRRNRELSAEEARHVETEKESKVKQKLWARATARWKENVRYTARQRRGKRTSIRSRAARSSTSLDYRRDGLTSGRSSPSPSSSPAPSRSQSRRNSTASLQHVPSMDDPASPQERAVPTISISPPANPHASPPAYRQKPLSTTDSSEGVYPEDGPVPCLRSRGAPHTTSCSQNDCGEMSSNHAAHVATDDKALLARLADLASQPFPNDSVAGPACDQQVSAPEWRDEELEEVIAATQEGSGDNDAQTSPSPTSPFPPPPSKANLASPNFYDYPYAFEEASFEPELGPSAPPFEETQAYGAREHDIPPTVPSAPPMLEDEDFYVELAPSAPPLAEVDGHDGGEGSDELQASAPAAPECPSAGGGPPSLNESDYASEAPSLPRYRP